MTTVRCPLCRRGLTVPDTAQTFPAHATEVAPLVPVPCDGAGWLIEVDDVIVGRWPRVGDAA